MSRMLTTRTPQMVNSRASRPLPSPEKQRNNPGAFYLKRNLRPAVSFPPQDTEVLPGSIPLDVNQRQIPR